MKKNHSAFIGVVVVVLTAILFVDSRAYSAPPLVDSEILSLFRNTSSTPDEKLDAIIQSDDAIAGIMITSDAAWLATEIAKTVTMAPFTDKRKACIEKVVFIARKVLSTKTHSTSTLEIIAMPSKCLLLVDEMIAVDPSYGEQELIGFLSEHCEDSNPEVRLFVVKQIGKIGIVDSAFKTAAIDFMESQDKIEQKLLTSAGKDPDYMEGNRSVIENLLGALKGTIKLKFGPTIISDVQYQALLVKSREELLQLVGEGDYFAWMVFLKSQISLEEEEALFKMASDSAASEFKLQILQGLTYGIRKDRPLKVESARIDRLLSWYRTNNIEADPNVQIRRGYIGMLHGLGLRGRDGTASRAYRRKASIENRRLRNGEALSLGFQLYNAEIHLEPRHGVEVDALLELFLNDVDDEVRKDAERALLELRSIYQK